MFNQLRKKCSILTGHIKSNNQKRRQYLLKQRQHIIQQQRILQQQQLYEKNYKLYQDTQSKNILKKASYFKYPKKLHLYWDKSPLSFLNYLTVLSFNKYHSNWKIYIYTPKSRQKHISWKTHEQKDKYNGKCYFNELYNIENVEIITIDLDKIGFYSDASEVIKSDYFRYYILYQKGGVWSDFDIIYTSSIEKKLNLINDCIIFSCYDLKQKMVYYPIGLFLAVPKTPFFKLILDSCKKFYDKTEYQSIGALMFKKILGDNINNCKKKLNQLGYNVAICTKQDIYLPLHWYEINKVYNNMNYNLSNENVGLHWFNGAVISKKYINKLDTRLKDFKVNCYLDSLIKEYINDRNSIINKKISIIMAYFNRKDQLKITLETIKSSKYKNKEIIIVDDNSRIDQRVDLFIDNYRNDLDIKVITIKENEKNWVNPCIAYNIGIKEASGEIIVLQNPEVMHVGYCLDFISKNLKYRDWLSFNCYGSPNFQFNKQIEKKTESEKFTDIYNLTFNIGGNSVERENVGGWLNHYSKHFVAYHYLAAIHKSDIYDYLDGGFNEKFKDGIGADDDELIKRLIFNKFNFKISKFESGIPFCIHLYHEKPESVKNLDWRDNKKIFIESCINMNMTPENNIHLAPKNEIPMFKQIII